MGWRGMLRSINAASRRADRERTLEANRNARAREKANRLVAQLSAEAQRDLRKVQAFEEKINRKPISTLRMRYTGNWQAERLIDRTGNIQFSVGPNFTSDPVRFQPKTIAIEGRSVTPLACCISQYATFVAFEVRIAMGTSGSRTRQLINRTTPENGSIAIIAGGEAFYAFDGSLDPPKFNSIPSITIVAFETFAFPIDDFTIAFAPTASKANPDPDAIEIHVTGNSLRAEIEGLPFAPSLVDQFEQSIRSQFGGETGQSRKSSNSLMSGCIIALVAAIVLPILSCLGLGFVGALISPPDRGAANVHRDADADSADEVDQSIAAADTPKPVEMIPTVVDETELLVNRDDPVKVVPSEIPPEKSDIPEMPSEPAFASRLFIDSTGRFMVEARLVSYVDGQVTIKRDDDGRELTLPFEKLSTADQRYVAAISGE